MPSYPYPRIRVLQGQSLDDCFVLLEYSLYEDFKDPETIDWSLVHILNGQRLTLLEGPGEASDVWVSKEGTIYLVARTDEAHGLHVGMRTEAGYLWHWQSAIQNEPVYVKRVFGVSEELVICWGGGMFVSSLGSDTATQPTPLNPAACWIGNKKHWIQHSLPGWVFGMGGQDPNSLIAVGKKGLVAYWNGETWTRDTQEPATDLSFIQILPNGELYGASSSGRVFKRTNTAWKEIGTNLGGIYGLVQWQGKLLIATACGLYRIEKDEFAVEQPSLKMYRVCAGKTLLWADEQTIHEIGESKMRKSFFCFNETRAAGGKP